MKKRLLSILLAFCMVLAILPETARGAEGTIPKGSAEYEELEDFLDHFRYEWELWGGHTYDFRNVTSQDGNILQTVIGYGYCYVGPTPSIDAFHGEKIWDEKDPLGSFDSYGYSRMEGTDVDWVLENVFNCLQKDIPTLRSSLDSGVWGQYYWDGYYYSNALGIGSDIGEETVITNITPYENYYLITYDLREWEEWGGGVMDRYFAVVQRKTIAETGKNYWSLYYHRKLADGETINFPTDGGIALTEKHGTCGDNLTWVLGNGTLTISGTGEMQNYWTPMDSMFGTTLLDDAPWSLYGNEINNVVIQSGVTSIGNRAFFGCNVSSVIIPNSIISIGYGAFEQTRLTDVYYSGTEAGWRSISISYTDYRNELLRDANIHYNSTSYAPSTSNGIFVTVGGKAVTWTDAAPFIDANSRTMVPLRAVADAMGLDVNWNASVREAVFTNGSKTIYFPIDSNTARTSNGSTVQMDTAAVIVNERTYAPIRYLAEYFGYEVGWDAATRTVTIK